MAGESAPASQRCGFPLPSAAIIHVDSPERYSTCSSSSHSIWSSSGSGSDSGVYLPVARSSTWKRQTGGSWPTAFL